MCWVVTLLSWLAGNYWRWRGLLGILSSRHLLSLITVNKSVNMADIHSLSSLQLIANQWNRSWGDVCLCLSFWHCIKKSWQSCLLMFSLLGLKSFSLVCDLQDGYFKIRRGTNECGIEGDVVTGLPSTKNLVRKVVSVDESGDASLWRMRFSVVLHVVCTSVTVEDDGLDSIQANTSPMLLRQQCFYAIFFLVSTDSCFRKN